MARTTEERVVNAIVGALSGKPEKVETIKPAKSYMAVSTIEPRVNEHFICKRIEKKSAGKIKLVSTETSTVQEVKKLANNIFVVRTRNSYYITRVIGMRVENVHFAVLREKPIRDKCLKCLKLDFEGEGILAVRWETTPVIETRYIKGIYRITTRNSTYICFPM